MTATPPVRLRWDLTTRADPVAAWAALSDTDRLNRLAGQGLRFEQQRGPDGKVVRRGWMRHAGLKLTWTELPTVFQAPEALRIERRFDNGPIHCQIAELTLSPAPGGTRVAYTLEFHPRHPALRPIVQVDARLTVFPGQDKALRQIVAALDAGRPLPDRLPPRLSRQALLRLDEGLQGLEPPAVADALHALILDAPLTEQARIRPLWWAQRLNLPPDQVVCAMLTAVRRGVLALRWEILCPSCRWPGSTVQQLDLRPGEVHCPSCDVAFDRALPDAVAVVFQPAPAVREVAMPIDCLSSPARTPHLVAQTLLAPGSEGTLHLPLLTGAYRLRTWPPLDTASLQVRPDVTTADVSLDVTQAGLQPAILRAGPGTVALSVRSRLAEPVRLVIERRHTEPWTLTVGQLWEVPGASELVPPEALAEGLRADAWHAPVVAVQAWRGGTEAGAVAAAWLREVGAVQVLHDGPSVLAILTDRSSALRACERLEGTRWLAAALAEGPVLAWKSQDGAVTALAGVAVQAAWSLARQAAPMDLRLDTPEVLGPVLQALVGPELLVEALPDGTSRLRFAVRRADPLPLPGPVLGPPQQGDVLDGFVLGPVLGRGGFGTVHEAVRLPEGTPCVVKVLQDQHADDPVQVQRFYNEGRLASRLRHPHVVQVLDYGEARGGRLFVAMERLYGRELADDLTDGRRIEPQRAVALVLQALDGLQAAHRLGLVHRDVKPQNLFVCEDHVVKLIDFGVALDTTGQPFEPGEGAVGTPLYMSPEQVQGRPLDGRSDLYAIGVVLYQCLSGRLPFSGDHPVAQLMARILQDPAPLPGDVRLPVGLATVVFRALERQPEDRWPDAPALQDALRKILT